MSLSEVRYANKKAKREAKRRAKQAAYLKEKQHTKVRNKRMRKMFIEGRREELRKREEQTQYVKQLESEILNEEA